MLPSNFYNAAIEYFRAYPAQKGARWTAQINTPDSKDHMKIFWCPQEEKFGMADDEPARRCLWPRTPARRFYDENTPLGEDIPEPPQGIDFDLEDALFGMREMECNLSIDDSLIDFAADKESYDHILNAWRKIAIDSSPPMASSIASPDSYGLLSPSPLYQSPHFYATSDRSAKEGHDQFTLRRTPSPELYTTLDTSVKEGHDQFTLRRTPSPELYTTLDTSAINTATPSIQRDRFLSPEVYASPNSCMLTVGKYCYSPSQIAFLHANRASPIAAKEARMSKNRSKECWWLTSQGLESAPARLPLTTSEGSYHQLPTGKPTANTSAETSSSNTHYISPSPLQDPELYSYYSPVATANEQLMRMKILPKVHWWLTEQGFKSTSELSPLNTPEGSCCKTPTGKSAGDFLANASTAIDNLSISPLAIQTPEDERCSSFGTVNKQKMRTQPNENWWLTGEGFENASELLPLVIFEGSYASGESTANSSVNAPHTPTQVYFTHPTTIPTPKARCVSPITITRIQQLRSQSMERELRNSSLNMYTSEPSPPVEFERPHQISISGPNVNVPRTTAAQNFSIFPPTEVYSYSPTPATQQKRSRNQPKECWWLNSSLNTKTLSKQSLLLPSEKSFVQTPDSESTINMSTNDLTATIEKTASFSSTTRSPEACSIPNIRATQKQKSKRQEKECWWLKTYSPGPEAAESPLCATSEKPCYHLTSVKCTNSITPPISSPQSFNNFLSPELMAQKIIGEFHDENLSTFGSIDEILHTPFATSQVLSRFAAPKSRLRCWLERWCQGQKDQDSSTNNVKPTPKSGIEVFESNGEFNGELLDSTVSLPTLTTLPHAANKYRRPIAAWRKISTAQQNHKGSAISMDNSEGLRQVVGDVAPISFNINGIQQPNPRTVAEYPIIKYDAESIVDPAHHILPTIRAIPPSPLAVNAHLRMENNSSSTYSIGSNSGISTLNSRDDKTTASSATSFTNRNTSGTISSADAPGEKRFDHLDHPHQTPDEQITDASSPKGSKPGLKKLRKWKRGGPKRLFKKLFNELVWHI